MSSESAGSSDERPIGLSSMPEGTILWEPSEERRRRSNIATFLRWLAERNTLRTASYQDCWEWSVDELDAFWGSIWDFYDVIGTPATTVLADRRMPGAVWFPGASLNYAEHALRWRDDGPAIIAGGEGIQTRVITRAQLADSVAALAASLHRHGLRQGDQVAAVMPNCPETIVAFLATASLGAIWSSCAPELGVASILDRFAQVGPSILFVSDGYRYGGVEHNRLPIMREVANRLSGVRQTILVPYLEPRATLAGSTNWNELLIEGAELTRADGPVFRRVAFEHPLWILFSSGTTGPPKAIVHGHGGIILEHSKALSLHLDLRPEDRFFWYTSTGWMMWNLLVGGLLVGATVVLYDGDPLFPSSDALWKFAADTGVTFFGTSAPYIAACMKEGLQPGKEHNLLSIHSLGSTASPLSPDAFAWVYQNVHDDLLLGSISGGTDVCTSLVISCPLLPVKSGLIQCRALGAKVEAYDEQGTPVIGEVGELVVTEPMPSMPIGFWNDPDGRQYQEAYFGTFPGAWRHGDWIRIDTDGSSMISGRSDATLKRGGIRMGTSEFYRLVEALPEIRESLVIEVGPSGEGRIMLFVVLTAGVSLDDSLRRRISHLIRHELSPRHVPDEVHAAPAIPHTLNGKRLEVPIRRLLMGHPVEEVISHDAIDDAASLEYFVRFAERSHVP